MKKNLLPVIISIACIFLSCSRNTNTVQEKKIKTQTGEAESEARERVRWEFKRLKEPATGRIPGMIREKELAYAATLPKANEHFSNGNARTNGTWDFRGPWNLGGRTRALAIDVSNQNVIALHAFE